VPAAPSDLIGTDDEGLEPRPPAPLELRDGVGVQGVEGAAERLAVGARLELSARRADDLERGRRKAGRKVDRLAEPDRLRAGRPKNRAAPDGQRVVRPLDPGVELGGDPLERSARYGLAGPVPLDVGAGGSAEAELAERAPRELRELNEDDRVPLAQARDAGDPRGPAPERQDVAEIAQESCGSIRP
jgi:hypothetical protein